MHFERLFTAKTSYPHGSMRFVMAGSEEEPLSPPFTVPDDWSLEAAQAFQKALCLNRPEQTKSVEENTTPSWLWQHVGIGSQVTHETSVLDVFNRIAGAAAYRGWKTRLWADENDATLFFDEVRAALITRRIVIAPHVMASLGLDWAYGLTSSNQPTAKPTLRQHAKTLVLQNDTIDAILRNTQPIACEKWQTFFQNSLGHRTTTIAFVDTIAQWGVLSPSAQTPSATLNLMAFRNDDGSIDFAGIKQATKLSVLLCELFYEAMVTAVEKSRPIKLCLGNLASLLMSLALPYDSEVGRGTAAALAAVVTATAASTSARLADKIGACPAFSQNRKSCLRAFTNRLRATFDEKNDYDRLAIIPKTLQINSGVDLVLIANARYSSEEALHLVQKHGLRHLHLTTMAENFSLAPLMDSTSTGSMAEACLFCAYAVSSERFENRIRPSVLLALNKLGYNTEDQKAIIHHIMGYRTLKGAPAINHAILREKGFGDTQLRLLELAIPQGEHLHHAFTPWVLGADFCRAALGMSDHDCQNPAFDILNFLNFTGQDINVANNFCYGNRSVKGAAEMDQTHIPVFETTVELSYEATLRMAAAIQSFITDEVSLSLDVSSSLNAQARAALVLRAWKLGIKSITLTTRLPLQNMLSLETRGPLTEGIVMKRKTPSLKSKTAISRKKGASVHGATGLRTAKPRATQQTISIKRDAPPQTRKTGKTP